MKNEKIIIDPIELTDGYIDETSWRTKENSNSSYNIGALILHQAGAVASAYWLDKVYPEKSAIAHKNADIHIHDMTINASYCCGWSIKDILENGLGGVDGKISAKPPKHLDSACNQLANFLGILQLENAGAQALNSFDTYLAPYIKKDSLTDAQIEHALESFLFMVNIPSRWGCQAPFSNLTLDFYPPSDMIDKNPVIGGEKQNFTYGDCIEDQNRLNKIFMKLFETGDALGNNFQYPILTCNATERFFEKVPEDVQELIFRTADKYGSWYFSNFINSELDENDLRSMCCRLRLDKRQLVRQSSGGLFGAADKTGSIGVVTINMPRIAFLASQNIDEFYKLLKEQLVNAKEALEKKRVWLESAMERGLFPYTKRYLGHWKNHFSTIGYVGMNEAAQNFFRDKSKTLNTKEGHDFIADTMDFMLEKLSDFQEETGNLYNLEATPAESTAYRLAKHDKKRFENIITAGTEDAPYYTNSIHLPVGITDDVWELVKWTEDLQCKNTGGTVFHIYVSEYIENWKAVRNMVKKILYNTKMPYITWSPTYSICKHGHGYIKGNTTICPKCKEIEIKKIDDEIKSLEKML